MVMLLEVILILFTRSIFVPSSMQRTLAVSAATSLPLAVYSLSTEAARFSAWKVVWLLVAISVASAGSAVIYGLRREVRHARQLGQYTLGEKLGEGGMGVVYKAQHAMLRRPTAIKLLKPERMGEAALQRFEREVQLTAGLSHPNTVTVFDYGRTPEGVFYYAMEYLEGLGLGQLVAADGAQPPARAAHILRQVLDALAEAHGVGLVHRDVKPANIILCERGGLSDVAKVVDFGLVKDLEADAGTTQDATLVGTPLYLPRKRSAPRWSTRAPISTPSGPWPTSS
jgi:serine/threonine-protein kinase